MNESLPLRAKGCFVVRYWHPHPCGGYYLHAAHHWTAGGRGGYAA